MASNALTGRQSIYPLNDDVAAIRPQSYQVCVQSVNISACCQGATQRFICPPGSFGDFVYLHVIYNTNWERDRRERRDTQSAESLITMLLAVIFSAAVMEVKSSRCQVKSCDESYPQINTSRATCRLYHDNNPITCVRPVSCFREILNHNEQHWLLILIRVSTLLFVFCLLNFELKD